MTGLVRKATLLALCGLFVGGVAMANVPDPTQSECPTFIRVVQSDGVTADPAGTFCITVRGLNGLPINGAVVTLDFSTCGISLCADQLDPLVTVNCTTPSVSKATNALGVVCFTVLGKNFDISCLGAPNCVVVTANTVEICRLSAATFDLGGAQGVGSEDLSSWIDTWGCGGQAPRTDYNGDGTVDSADLSAWITLWGAGTSSVGCVTKCP